MNYKNKIIKCKLKYFYFNILYKYNILPSICRIPVPWAMEAPDFSLSPLLTVNGSSHP